MKKLPFSDKIEFMKILFITDLYPIGEEKIAKALFYFVQEWKNQGHEIEVIRPNFKLNTLIRGRKIIKEDIYTENEIKIYNLNFNTPFLLNIYNKLPKDFSLKNYDVLISHMPCGSLMAQALLKKEQIKYICSVHASDIKVLTDKKYNLYFKNKLKKSYLLADKISARSPILKAKIENIIPETKEKTFVAFSGIEEELINSRTKTIDKNNIKLITISSLIKRKNIDTIIKAVSKTENVSLKIIGEGKEKKRLKKITLNCKNKIEFLGQLKREDVIKELNNSDVFVLLSDNETFGLSYLEAMATGNIVIAKKNDGIDGIIKDNFNGFLIKNNTEDLKKCIAKIQKMEENELINFQKNIITTIKQYTIEIASQKYIDNIIEE